MATEDVWDQTAYNEEQFYASYGSYHSPGVTQRLMNYLCFQNSKLLWRYVREDAAFYPTLTPVSVHVNYHPEKPNRMVDLLAQVGGALWPEWNLGWGGKSCLIWC